MLTNLDQWPFSSSLTAAPTPALRALALAGLVQLSWIHVLHPPHPPIPTPTLQLLWKIEAACWPHQNAGRATRSGGLIPKRGLSCASS